MTVRYPINKKSVDLGVVLYYRGAKYSIPVDVYTTMVRVNVQPAVSFWPDPTWDNDVYDGDPGALKLAKLLEVTATYKAANSDKTSDVPLIYWYATTDEDRTVESFGPTTYALRYGNSFGRGYRTGPYYLFAPDEDDQIDDDFDAVWVLGSLGWERRIAKDGYSGDSSYAKGFQKYLDNLIKGKHETTTNVTIRHFMNVEDIVDYYGAVFEGRYETERYAYNSNWLNSGFSDWPWGPWANNMVAVDIANGNRGANVNMLPNGYNWYDTTNNKYPWQPKGTLGRNFGPKINQTKKAKVAVTWQDHD